MTTGITLGLLVAAGAALVAQNLLMTKIAGTASTVLVALLMNAAVGLVLLSALLLRKSGLSGFGKSRFWKGLFRLSQPFFQPMNIVITFLEIRFIQ